MSKKQKRKSKDSTELMAAIVFSQEEHDGFAFMITDCRTEQGQG